METSAVYDALDEVAAVLERARSRHGAAFRDLVARIERLAEAGAWRDAPTHQLGPELYALGAPRAVADILRDARTLGV